jgi:hypothetical protein
VIAHRVPAVAVTCTVPGVWGRTPPPFMFISLSMVLT